ncbi:MATE family efflux transporter [Agrobacterium fabrum]|uniref:MATE family efflux transporter n=1 Tax=Agrobacterium fabrum TaxID=1176649 RepID=UPI001571C5C6|nr:MATE family efflux transporter [Agrobacterium fabrum]WCK79995.1 MATE family efflux transporter [Agrobacterium fabrum]
MPSASHGFTHDPIAKVLLRTALPVVFLTSTNGLLTVVDAMLLGVFVGPEALAAVTLMFPISMLLLALSTMVSSGMASIVARQLGAGRLPEAKATVAGAHGLSILICVILGVALLAFSQPVIAAVTSDQTLAAMGHQFLMISVLTSPIMFLVSVHSDALRVEGKIGFMALAGLLVSLGNIAFNILLIAGFGLGVAGSAWGTAAAQGVALGVMLGFRLAGKARLPVPTPGRNWLAGWTDILALGAPRSLGFFGIALGATATITSVGFHVTTGKDAIIAAYGVVTRIMTFAYLPLMGLNLAMQAVVGNNYGAGHRDRAVATLRLSMLLALIYCGLVEAVLLVFRGSLGGVFLSDDAVVGEVGRMLPFYAALYFTMGPTMTVAGYLQSIGDAKHTALLSVARTYFFAIPLTFALPLLMGETGIWAALPVADLMLVLITVVVLSRRDGALQRGSDETN